jgi:hypothetical protein
MQNFFTFATHSVSLLINPHLPSMRFALPVFFCIFYTGAVSGQQLYPLKQMTDSVRFQLVVRQGILELQWMGEAPVWKRVSNFPEIRSVRLEEGDLMVDYAPGKATAQSAYSLAIRVTAADGPIISPNGYETRETAVSQGADPLRRYIWLDAAEALFAPGRTYTLYVTRRLMGSVSCEGDRPVFSMARRLPYYGSAVVGTVAAGLGVYLFRRSTDEYTRYEEIWANERTEAEAQPFLDRARRADRNGQVLLYSGLAVLGTDALLYYLKWRKIRQKQRLYDDFCGAKTSLHWQPGLQLHSNGRLGVGATLSYRF